MTLFGVAGLALLLAWVFGGALLRLAGLLLVLAGVLALAGSANADGILVTAIGAILWLIGHGHYALRHGAWKSRLAAWVWESVAATLGRLLAVAGSRLDPDFHRRRLPSIRTRVEGEDDEYSV